VAVKKLHSENEIEFLKERTILQEIEPKNHSHLIKLLATYRQKGKYHLVFPYADANLRKYWEDRPLPNFDKATVLWSLKQMTGIANALVLVHNFSVVHKLNVDGPGQVRVQDDGNLKVGPGEEVFGRHGDIKPENILWFKQSCETDDVDGILKVADFGLGRFHGRESRSKVNPDTVLSSPTYEPPECKLRRPVSRAYDIWSLGCLYLEFITWILVGSAEIIGFSEFRGVDGSLGINEDNFFAIVRDEESGLGEAVVREQVVDWVNKLHENTRCSALIHDLLKLIMDKLLVIDSKDRICSNLLHQELDTLLEKAMKDDQYLLKPDPWSPDASANATSKSTTPATDTPNANIGSRVTFAEPEHTRLRNSRTC
jgi:serine/threonine protein kinase